MAEIIVGVDGSANSAAALRWARGEADRRGDQVIALFAWGFVPPGHAGGGHTFDVSYGSSAADEALAGAIEAAVGVEAAAGIKRRVICDVAPSALLSAASAADLLVVGARGVGGFRGLLLGSVSQQCLHHTKGPLAIVRVPPPGEVVSPPSGRIVVGLDGSESARRALRWAIDEARLRGARVDVVRAWAAFYPAGAPVIGYPIDVDTLERDARAELDEVLARQDAHGLASPLAGRLVLGEAAPAVLEAARGADLVVLGTRGHGGFAGLLLGSVTHHVAHHVACPLVVVP